MEDVRAVGPDGWRLWRNVRLRALADAPDAFGSSLAEWERADERRWRRRLNDVPFNVVAVNGDVPVGQASGTAPREDRHVELISIWVVPESRGTGVARALVDAVTEWAGGVGAMEVRLSVRPANERATRLYRRTGYVQVDEPGDEPDELTMGGHCTPEWRATPGGLPPTTGSASAHSFTASIFTERHPAA